MKKVLVCQKCAQEKALHIKLEEERDQENFISYVEAYYELTPRYEKKGIRQIHHDFNKNKSNHQTTSHEYYFSTTFSEHSNGLYSIIVFNCDRNKQDKGYSNHQLLLRIP